MTQYYTRANKMKQINNNSWKIIESNTLLKDVSPSAPSVSFRRALTIGDKLVHSYLPGGKRGRLISDLICGSCNHCDTTQQANHFKGVYSKTTCAMQGFINCSTSHVIYHLQCLFVCFFMAGEQKEN